jgi:hypothetical protein
MTAFWDTAPCFLVDRPDDGSSKHLWSWQSLRYELDSGKEVAVQTDEAGIAY